MTGHQFGRMKLTASVPLARAIIGHVLAPVVARPNHMQSPEVTLPHTDTDPSTPGLAGVAISKIQAAKLSRTD